jgi:ADP-ribose pyrophosphatase YjhB (NUDIX family)
MARHQPSRYGSSSGVPSSSPSSSSSLMVAPEGKLRHMSASSRFRNRLNPRHELGGGRVLYESRSVAVTAVVLAWDDATRGFRALVGERGSAVDHAGKWCLSCGYLDWDESLVDAVHREVFEETGLDLRALEASGDAVVSSEPIFIEGVPEAHRQNVTARFVVELRRVVEPTTANAEPDEVTRLEWLEVSEAAIATRGWAFKHDEILGELAAFYGRERAAGQLDAGSTRRFYRAVMESRYPFA